jgi:hypothetical protein
MRAVQVVKVINRRPMRRAPRAARAGVSPERQPFAPQDVEKVALDFEHVARTHAKGARNVSQRPWVTAK